LVSPAELISSPRPGFGPMAVQMEALGRGRGAGKNLFTCGNDTTKGGYTCMSEASPELQSLKCLRGPTPGASGRVTVLLIKCWSEGISNNLLYKALQAGWSHNGT
jgi:hypothetical protein